jgi:hypothetical protein
VRALAAAAVASLLPALFPGAAAACAVCTSGRDDDTQRAFLLGTILLSTLPLALIGGIALWLRRRAREASAREQLAEGERASSRSRAPAV